MQFTSSVQSWPVQMPSRWTLLPPMGGHNGYPQWHWACFHGELQWPVANIKHAEYFGQHTHSNFYYVYLLRPPAKHGVVLKNPSYWISIASAHFQEKPTFTCFLSSAPTHRNETQHHRQCVTIDTAQVLQNGECWGRIERVSTVLVISPLTPQLAKFFH